MIVGGWDRDGGFDRKGVRVAFQGGAIARVCDSGRPERVDIETVPPEVQAGMEEEGVISQVAAPIVVVRAPVGRDLDLDRALPTGSPPTPSSASGSSPGSSQLRCRTRRRVSS